jgi:hypothetical protein
MSSKIPQTDEMSLQVFKPIAAYKLAESASKSISPSVK